MSNASELAKELKSLAETDPAMAAALDDFISSPNDPYSFGGLVDDFGPNAAGKDRDRFVKVVGEIEKHTEEPAKAKLKEVAAEVEKKPKPRAGERDELSPDAIKAIVDGLLTRADEKIHQAEVHAVTESLKKTKAALDIALADPKKDWRAVLTALSAGLLER